MPQLSPLVVLILLALLQLQALTSICQATMPPNPLPYRRRQPDGISTGDLYRRGTPEEHNVREEDSNGFTILHDDRSKYDVYAILDPATGDLAPSRCVVGSCDPRKEGLVRNEQPDWRIKKQLWERTGGFGRWEWGAGGDDGNDNDGPGRKHPPLHRSLSRQKHQRQTMQRRQQRQTEEGPAVMKNLVLLLLFPDHKDRTLPSRDDYDVLFNTVDANPVDHPQCPTGSVREFYLFNSYGKLDVQSEVFDWIELPETEAYYADNYYGLTGTFQKEGIKYGLDKVEQLLIEQGRNFREFDSDGDSWIDSFTVIHSGFDASTNGNDCYAPDKESESRIWSHKWQIPGEWRSKDHIRVRNYHANSGLWGSCGSEICRIGVIAHEHGHFFGLHDLYDGVAGGAGVGCWDIMGDAWGFDGSQRYPPMMMPAHKVDLGWIHPVELLTDGTYHLPASHSEPFVYIVKKGYANGEYIYIENRQRYHKFEALVPPGLIIWHVDSEARITTQGHPGMDLDESDGLGWPENGRHYRYSILAADGRYDLERGKGQGDEGDVFHSDFVDAIGPDGVYSRGIRMADFPNTMSYQSGIIRRTGHHIYSISASLPIMTFSFKTCLDCDFNDRMMASSQEPAPSPIATPTDYSITSTTSPTRRHGTGTTLTNAPGEKEFAPTRPIESTLPPPTTTTPSPMNTKAEDDLLIAESSVSETDLAPSLSSSGFSRHVVAKTIMLLPLALVLV